jgi:phosphoribosylformimino-5-aminoimidazole carboxamide ribotide isomerase
MRILTVIDLKEGQVVRGVAGRRQEYRPVVSRLAASAEPAAVARAFRAKLGLSELYLADLDAIAGAGPALAVYQSLQSLGCRLWVDAGIHKAAEAKMLAKVGVDKIVVGLETVAGPDELEVIGRELGRDRIAFSLDLKDGQPLGARAAWDDADAATIAARVSAAGVRDLIVLDLGRVGVNQGTGTEELCRRLATAHPHLCIIAGGGVRNRDDLRRLQQCGVRAALVASALHDEKLTAADLKDFAY